MALAVVFVAGMRHLNAQLVNAAEKTFRCGHAVLDALVPDEFNRFH